MFTKEDEEKFVKVYDNFTIKELKEMFEIGDRTVKKLMQKHGLESKITKTVDERGYIRCPECKQYLPPEEFNNNKNKRTGKGTYCRNCKHQKAKVQSSLKKAVKEEETKIKKIDIKQFKKENENMKIFCKECKAEFDLSHFRIQQSFSKRENKMKLYFSCKNNYKK